MKRGFVTILVTAVLALSMVIFGPFVHLAVAQTGSSGSTGQSSDGAQPPASGHKPPPEAYKVCEGKTVGTSAHLVTPRGDTITGVCKELDGKMVLVPDFDKNRKCPRPPKAPEQSSGQ